MNHFFVLCSTRVFMYVCVGWACGLCTCISATWDPRHTCAASGCDSGPIQTRLLWAQVSLRAVQPEVVSRG